MHSLLGEVYVVEDVILTEAVVARALAAIAELKLGIRHIGAAAYGTFMTKALRLLLILLLLPKSRQQPLS